MSFDQFRPPKHSHDVWDTDHDAKRQKDQENKLQLTREALKISYGGIVRINSARTPGRHEALPSNQTLIEKREHPAHLKTDEEL